MKKIIPSIALLLLLNSCSNSNKESELRSVKESVIDSVNNAAAINANRQHIVDSMNLVNQQKETLARHHQNSGSTVTEPEKKKGMNNTSKGALIGGGAGAVTGALAGAALSQDKGKGALIGGIIGAAAGTGAGALTGRSIDKKKEEKK